MQTACSPLSPEKVHRNAAKAEKLSLSQLKSIRRRIAPRTCSINWEDQCLESLLGGKANLANDPRPPAERRGSIDPLLIELAKRGIYPPPSERDPMRWCDSRGCRRRLYPRQYVRKQPRVDDAGEVMTDRQGHVLIRRRCVDCLEAIRERQQRQFERECDNAGVQRGPDQSGGLDVRQVAEMGLEVPQIKLAPESDEALQRYVARVSSRQAATIQVSF